VTLNVFGSAPAGLTPFGESEKGEGDRIRLLDFVGESAIFEIVGPKEITTTNYGVKTAIECSVVVLKGDGLRFEDCLIFGAAPVDQMKGLAGQTIVAEIEAYDTKQGGKAPRLKAPSEAAIAAAKAYSEKASA
jgi:hypothetical protein